MSPIIQTSSNNAKEDTDPGLIKRTAVLVYGLTAYHIGVTGLMWIILAMGGLAPIGFSPLQAESSVVAMMINLGLITLFGLQHSIMARGWFKQWLETWLPKSAERSTYVMLSGVFMSIAIYFWQPVTGIIWSVDNSIGQIVLWAAYAAGWSYLFIATFVTNHFELMGLRQVYLYFKGESYSPLPFTRKYMYRYSRHPMMLGVLVGIWALPVMTVSHFIMSSLLTLYIIIGVTLEERDLAQQFGETYKAYKKEIAALIPNWV